MRNTLLYILLVLCILFSFSSLLHSTQPFWSMDPSTKSIERADSLTGFDITKYVISLSIDDQSHYVSGCIEAFVTAEDAISSIEYRLEGGSLAVTEVQVNNVLCSFTHQDGIISIPVSANPGDQFTTKVYYSGIPGNSPAPYNIGLKFTSNGFYTLSNPDAGRFWWPSYDHPWDKALVDWHITVREDWLAAANGIRTEITDNGDGTRTHHWVCASPVATYVIGFAAAPYVEYNQQAGDIPIQNFVLPGQLSNAMEDFANVPEMISYFSQLYGAYPFEKYGHMVVNMSTYAAMEHQTMTTFGAQYLNGQQTYESIVAHELTHQWYGNYLTPITMREVWLKESFATYSEALWVNHKSGWQASCDYMRDEIQQYYLNWENSNGPHTIFNPEYNLMFAPPTYEKSASVLHMLRLKMGNDNFFQFIRALLTTYPNSNIKTTEFISLAEQISGLDLTQFFYQWIYSPGVPNAALSVFHNNAGQAKVYARSISPTDTQFYLDIPLHVPGSALADSVVVIASPEGYTNYFDIEAYDNLSSIQIDPHNWVLTRALNSVRMQLISCLPYNGAVSLGWNSFAESIPLSGYHVYRQEILDGGITRITATPINALEFTDTNVTNGTLYRYYVCAVDAEGFISLPSNTIDAMPIAFPFDQGFLVVDETRDGNGTVLSPTDAMVDDFYSSAMPDFAYTQWDYASQGALDMETLSHYPLVLWHCDDFSELQLLNNLDLLGSYVLGGGKLLLSGWKYPSVFSAGFLARFMPGVTPNYINSAVFVSAQSQVYPALYPDPAKLAAAWNGMLPMCYTFPGAQDAPYSAEIVNSGAGNGNPAAIRIVQGGTMILLGFPLYLMQTEGVSGFLNQILPELYPGLIDPVIPIAPITLNCYPSPFYAANGLSIKIGNANPHKLEIFNLKGQKVYTTEEFNTVVSGNLSTFSLPPSATEHLASGCYIIRVRTDRGRIARRVILLR